MRVICRACGALCVPQSGRVDGRDDLYACPNGHTSAAYADECGNLYEGYWPLDPDFFEVEE